MRLDYKRLDSLLPSVIEYCKIIRLQSRNDSSLAVADDYIKF